MPDSIRSLITNPGFMPHIHCYLDRPNLVWTMFATDMLIGLAYVAISITLWALVKRIRLQFDFVVVCFGVFILACGLTHFLEVWTLWHPDYWLAAGVKGVTALASVGTGIYLYRLRHAIVGVAATAKAAAERREAEFRAFFETASVGFAKVDISTRRFFNANQTYQEIVGYSLEELRRLTPFDITHPDDRANDLEQM